jgi:hypothetical protein
MKNVNKNNTVTKVEERSDPISIIREYLKTESGKKFIIKQFKINFIKSYNN